MTVASSRRTQMKETAEEIREYYSLAEGIERAYVDDVELLLYTLEQTEAELDAMTRDRNSYRASYNAERALRKREREGARGRFGRWIGL